MHKNTDTNRCINVIFTHLYKKRQIQMKPLHNLILKHNFIKLTQRQLKISKILNIKIKASIASPATINYKIPEIILIHMFNTFEIHVSGHTGPIS